MQLGRLVALMSPERRLSASLLLDFAPQDTQAARAFGCANKRFRWRKEGLGYLL